MTTLSAARRRAHPRRALLRRRQQQAVGAAARATGGARDALHASSDERDDFDDISEHSSDEMTDSDNPEIIGDAIVKKIKKNDTSATI